MSDQASYPDCGKVLDGAFDPPERLHSFTTTEYAEGVQWLRAALEGAGWDITYQPAHVAAREFPFDAGVLSAFDCVMLSDIGSNTLLLHPKPSCARVSCRTGWQRSATMSPTVADW